ncbi:hypothetical protein MYX07_05580 [Patescibacteria group bacterium AH-259-L07]|nr:hypothetical protein [Patescibacteria group bacterium AH-259-L07]
MLPFSLESKHNKEEAERMKNILNTLMKTIRKRFILNDLLKKIGFVAEVIVVDQEDFSIKSWGHIFRNGHFACSDEVLQTDGDLDRKETARSYDLNNYGWEDSIEVRGFNFIVLENRRGIGSITYDNDPCMICFYGEIDDEGEYQGSTCDNKCLCQCHDPLMTQKVVFRDKGLAKVFVQRISGNQKRTPVIQSVTA